MSRSHQKTRRVKYADPLKKKVHKKIPHWSALAGKSELSSEKTRRTCDPSKFSFKSTVNLPPPKGMLGQERALESLEFGFEIRKKGYNIFALGPSGTGKASSVMKLLSKRAPKEPTPPDICYIYNFEEENHPMILRLPAGMGTKLAGHMDRFVGELDRRIPHIISSRLLSNIRASLIAECRVTIDRIKEKLMESARKEGLWVQQEEDRLMIAPMVGGEPLGPKGVDRLPPEKQQELEQKVADYQQRIASFERMRTRLELETKDLIHQEERHAITPCVDDLVEEIKDAFREVDAPVSEYLDRAREFVLDNHGKFLPPEENSCTKDGGRDSRQTAVEDASAGEKDDDDDLGDLLELKVNVLVDRSRLHGAPVIYEPAPTPSKLMGYLEYRDGTGVLSTDHTLIRAGALHIADGGYLILQASELDPNSGTWNVLKRTIESRQIRIEENREENQHRLKGSVSPQPMDMDVKIILLGTGNELNDFQNAHVEFDSLFKVKADFEESFFRNKRNELKIARFIGKVCREEGFRPFGPSGVAEIVDFCSRKAEDQKRLSIRLADVVDLVTESDYWAGRLGARLVTGSHVSTALDKRRERLSKMEDQIMEDILNGRLLIHTEGAVVGQINGISVYELGDYCFGVPCRITASAFMGKAGVVHIDREVKLSGALHDKGALILSGFLGSRYAQKQVMAMSASVTFEQNYEEVEGDSASAAELFAILSSLSGVPIRQEIAVTGSVSQKGELQPIGSVNEKIEGIFRICKHRGLTGTQGVLIPEGNKKHLMLCRDLVKSVKKGLFHIWAVRNVDEGMEIITGCPSGKQLRDGTFTPDTINAFVAERLAEYSLKQNLCSMPNH